MHWLPPRRYAIPARPLATARGVQTACTGTLFSCTDGIFTGWGDAPDAAVHRGHREAVENFAKEIAELHMQAQQRGLSLGALLHELFPQWTVAPRKSVQLQATVDFSQLAADPRQASLRALGLTWLKVKLSGVEPPEALLPTLLAAGAHGWHLRLDVNGAWQNRLDRPVFLAICQRAAVAYVEDPVPVAQLPIASPVPLAADAIDSSVPEVMAAALAGRCQVVVVKPALWGGVARLLADLAQLHAAGVGVVLSSAFEGPEGLAHLAELAAVLPTELPAGLATHLLWPRAWQPPVLDVADGQWQRTQRGHARTPVALVCARAGQLEPVTLGQLQQAAHALAAQLTALGVGPGELVATWAGNRLEILVVWHAVQLLSATWLPLHPRLTASEVAQLLRRAQPHVLLADPATLAEVTLDDCHLIDLNLLGSLPKHVVLPQDHAPRGDAALLFTSGSTGRAKGVQLSWQALAAAADAALAQFGAQPGGNWLCCLPICHVSGLLIVQRAQRLGMTVLLADQPTTHELAALFHALPPRLASLVPAQLTRLLDENCAAPQELLAVIVGGAPCPPELVDRARAAGWPVLPSYGMTETAAQVATAPLATRLDRTPWPRADDAVCVGPATPGVELRIVAGEILVRSRQLLTGYLGETAAIADGWLQTGDLGRLDTKGWLWVIGRRGELILRGGENVTPDEVEAVLLAIPGVREVCVVGIPDRVLGQQVAAWLTVAEPVPDAVLQRHLAVLAPFKRPQRWLQTSQTLPRTGPGKVARAQVRARLVTSP